MDRVFLDTSFLLAFVDKEDEHHQKAKSLMRDFLEGEVLLSGHVFVETVNTVFSRSDHEKAKNLAKYLTKSEIKVVQLNQPGFENANKIFQDKAISFTDCSVPAAMNMLGVEKLATFDRDFEKFEQIEKVP